MHNRSTNLSDDDINALAALMANNPEFASKLADAVARRVGEELETRGWDGAGIEDKLDKVLDTQSSHGELLETMHHNIQDLRARHDIHDREFKKVNKRLDNIDVHLGINTDTRRRA